MKLKGISTIEQHVEKIVLGVFGLFALAMLVLQFDIFGDPNAIDIGQGRRVSPENATETVRDMARSVGSKLNAQTTPDLPELPPLQSLYAKISGERAPAAALALAAPYGATTESASTEPVRIDGDQLVFEIDPPAPTNVVVAVYEGTVDPFEPLYFPSLAAHLPKAQPFDKRFVSIQGTFDAAALLAQLRDGAGERSPLPTAWWQGVVELLDVEIERRRLGSDGQWEAPETVAPLPGRPSLRAMVRDESLAPRELRTLIDSERRDREQIRRPRFYNMISGELWSWPSQVRETKRVEPAPDELRLLRGQLDSIDRQIKTVRDSLDKLPGGAGGPPPGIGNPDRPPAPGGPGGRPPPPRGDSRGGRNGDPSAHAEPGRTPWPDIPVTWYAQIGDKPSGLGGGGADPSEGRSSDARRQQLNARLTQLQNQRATIVKRLNDIGYDEQGNRLQAAASPTGRFEEPLNSLTDAAGAAITVWAHDITAEPGETYSYRLRVWVTNPMFGHVAQLADEQKSLASKPAVASLPSEWSAPVPVERNTRFFITAARETGGLGGATAARVETIATAEVYQFFYGWWRKGTVQLNPGDQVRASIELPELPIFDVKLDASGRPSVAGESLVEPRTRTVEDDNFLLGVARVLFGTTGFETFMRSRGGEVIVLPPLTQAAEQIRSALAASAELGATAKVARPGSAPQPPGAPGAPAPTGPSSPFGNPDERPSPGGGSPMDKPTG